METVLAAFIAIFITMFAAFSLTATVLSTQDTFRVNLQAMQSRLDARSRTELLPGNARIINLGTVLELVYRNQGATKLVDFDHFDLIIQYLDNAIPADYHIGWMPYTIGVPLNNEWSVSGIYANAAQSLPEAFDPGILNPGEELKVAVKLSPPVGEGKTVQVLLETDNGVSASTQLTRNGPPVLVTNSGLSVANGTPGTIDGTKLAVTDGDYTPDQLVYTITTPPSAGILSLGPTFTQADILNGLLTYTRTGAASDSFAFTIAD